MTLNKTDKYLSSLPLDESLCVAHELSNGLYEKLTTTLFKENDIKNLITELKKKHSPIIDWKKVIGYTLIDRISRSR